MLKDSNKLNVCRFVILVVVFLLYGNSIKNEYALDDDFVTSVSPEKRNLKVEKGISGIPGIFSSHYVSSRQQNFEYRPFAVATFAIEYEFFESNPHISHFINVLIYAGTCLLIFAVLVFLFRNQNPIFPLIVSLLFAAHPLHSEVVSNIKCRDELLTLLFGFSSLYFALKFAESRAWVNLILAFLFIFLSFFCKKTAVLFLIFIPVTLYFFTSIKPKQLLYSGLILIFAYVAYTFVRINLVNSQPTEREFVFFENPMFYEKGLINRFAAAFNTTAFYLRLFLIPTPLSCYYGYETVPVTEWTSPLLWFGLIVHSTLAYFTIINVRKKNLIAYCGMIYFLGIIPFANLFTPVVGIVAERFVYFASFAFCLILTLGLSALFKTEWLQNTKKKPANNYFIATISVLIVFYSVKTISRNTQWHDLINLLRRDVITYERSCNLHYLLASSLRPEVLKTPAGQEKSNLMEEARNHFEEAARLMQDGLKKYPKDFTTLNNLGTIYVDVLNKPEDAQPLFKKVTQLNPENPEGWYNYSYCYEKRNMPDSAIANYNLLVSRIPDYLPAYFRLFELHMVKKNYSGAISISQNAIKRFPEEVRLYIDIGNAYMLNKDTLNALSFFEQAVGKAPTDQKLILQIAEVFKITGRKEKAEEFIRKAKNLPTNDD